MQVHGLNTGLIGCAWRECGRIRWTVLLLFLVCYTARWLTTTTTAVSSIPLEPFCLLMQVCIKNLNFFWWGRKAIQCRPCSGNVWSSINVYIHDLYTEVYPTTGRCEVRKGMYINTCFGRKCNCDSSSACKGSKWRMRSRTETCIPR